MSSVHQVKNLNSHPNRYIYPIILSKAAKIEIA